MAILTRTDIKKEISEGRLSFSPPLDQFQMQPHAIDLRLGTKFMIPKSWEITEKGRAAIKVAIDSESSDSEYEQIDLKPGQYFEILPDEFVIATSLENITLKSPNLMAILFPRTSTNRRGLNLSLSGIIDTGYEGTLIFPIKNETNQVIRIYPGERICQIILQELSGDLTPEEANLHGAQEAKYTEGSSGSYKLDKQEERDAIIAGELDSLKQSHRI
ncbi:dCTP deaminase [Candidatus Uhrbacteria bacterium]|nr:dCTP deaminase [Candidatus Uhrbacteria bacterium]